MANLLESTHESRVLRVLFPEFLLHIHRQNLPGESSVSWSQAGAQLSLLPSDADCAPCFAMLDSKGDSIVAADSNAKKMGVRSGMHFTHARAIHPKLWLARTDPTRVDHAQNQVILALMAAGVVSFARASAAEAASIAFFIREPATRSGLCRLQSNLDCLNLGPVQTSQIRSKISVQWYSVSPTTPRSLVTNVLKKDYVATLCDLRAQAVALFGDGACQWQVDSENGYRLRLHAKNALDTQPLADSLDSSGISGEQSLRIALLFDDVASPMARQLHARSPLQDAIRALQDAVGADRVLGIDAAAKRFVPVANDFGLSLAQMRTEPRVFQSKMRAAPASLGTILLARAPKVGDTWPLRAPTHNPKAPAQSIVLIDSHENGLHWLQSSRDVFALFRELPSGVWQLVGVMD